MKVAVSSEGDLKSNDEVDAKTNYRQDASILPGRGRGMGRGRGFGRGQGGRRFRNRGMGRCGTGGPLEIAAIPQSKDQELEKLKRQADSLNIKMKEVISRIDSLEKQ